MDPVVVIIICFIALLCIVAGYYIVDTLSKKTITKPAPKPAASEPKKESVPVMSVGIDNEKAPSNLANEVEDLIAADQANKVDKVEIASERSRMRTRQARMLEYYDKKYKGRTIFDPNGFDEPFDPSTPNNPKATVMNGVEISQDDIKKLVALQGFLERKTNEE